VDSYILLSSDIHTYLKISLHGNCERTDMKVIIDKGAYLMLRSAIGAYTCRKPPIPSKWNSVDRPHVAVLMPSNEDVFRLFLSNPVGTANPGHRLEITKLEELPIKSIIEVRHCNLDYRYYRRDNAMWTKVAEARNPFVVEVFSHGCTPIDMDIQTGMEQAHEL
jgi:hypothetical protein